VYRIDPSEIEEDLAKWKKALTATGIVLASPVLIPAAVIYILSMYIGPTWWKNKAIQKLINFAMGKAAELMDSHRQELLQHILPSDKVLDLGAGGGHYMKYPCQAGKLVGLEPNLNFHESYKQKAIDAGLLESQVEIYNLVIESYVAENPKQLGTFDWIILGNVLCEVEDQLSTLNCVNQLLKQGGHVYFSEHIASPPGTWKRTIQNAINPVWQVASGGCNCNRDSLANIRQTPGWQVIFWKYDQITVAMGPFVLGLAIKSK
jgi:SAM-dependent methyltransferase